MNFQLLVTCLILPILVFAQFQPISPPGTLQEAREIGERGFKEGIEKLPGILEKIWKEEVLPIWRGMYNWAKKNIWDLYIFPLFKKEVKQKKEVFKKELEKEKKELKEEIKVEIFPETFKSLWQELREFIK